MILQAQISRLSNRIFKEHGGRRIPENILERDYCIAWFLIGLARCSVRNKLAFKGGTALRRCHFSEYRFSEDLDFTLLDSISFEELKKQLEPIYDEVKRAANINFRFLRMDTVQHQNSYTFYLEYEGPLSIPKEIKVDITIKEKICNSPLELPVLKSFPEFIDLPEGETILVYSLEEIATEKTVALLDPARTEPRDLYDLWYLCTEANLYINECVPAIEKKLEHRGRKLIDVSNQFNNKEKRLEKTWNTRLEKQIANLPEFKNVFRTVKKAFRQAKITTTW